MTTEILFVAFGEWVLGAIACKLIVYGQVVTLASATFLLTGMAIDRSVTPFSDHAALSWQSSLCESLPAADPGGPWGPAPLAPKICLKSCSF